MIWGGAHLALLRFSSRWTRARRRSLRSSFDCGVRGRARRKAATFAAMWAASSLTQPNSADPRVCCQDRPTKCRPGEAVTPRLCRRGRLVEHGGVDPPMVGPEAGGPDDAATSRSAVGELTVDPAAATARPWSSTPCRRARRGVEPIRVSSRSASAGRCATPSSCGGAPAVEVPEQVAPEDPLRQRRLARADRQVHLARSGQLLRDLEARVAAADDEDAPVRYGLRRAVGRAVHLHDALVSSLGDRRDERQLERAGGDHHLVGLVCAVVELDDVPPFCRRIAPTRLFSSTGRSKRRA